MSRQYELSAIADMLKSRKITPEQGLALYKKLDLTNSEANGGIRKEPSILLYRQHWAESRLDVEVETASPLLLIGHDSQRLRRINASIEHVEGMIDKVVSVCFGERFEELDGQGFVIARNNEADLHSLFSILENRLEILPSRIVYIAPQWDGELAEAAAASWAYEMMPLFSFVKTAIRRQPSRQIQFLYVFSDTQQGAAFHQGMNGFLKSVQAEHHSFLGRTISFAASDDTMLASIIMGELACSDRNQTEICYIEGTRWIKELREVTGQPMEVTTTACPKLRENGVYVITGGAKGIGYLVARHLAKKYRAKLVLAGRSRIMEVEGSIAELQSYGSEVIYVEADVATREDAYRLIATAQSKFGALHGIIHSAGSNNDSLLINKKIEESLNIFGPKIRGTIYLDEASKDESLDFFMLFSSLASIFGNRGQSDYAFANGFMDEYARWRDSLQRAGKTVSVNWPFWENGGMKLEQDTKDYLTNVLGLHSLSDQDGMLIFEWLLTQSDCQAVVLTGNRDKITTQIKGGKEQQHTRGNVAEVLRQKDDFSPSDKELQGKVNRDLTNCVHELLKTDLKRIDPDSELSSFGFDSITLTRFSNRLNGLYRLDIMPSIFFEFPTLRALSGYFISEHKEHLCRYYGLSSFPPEMEAHASVAEAPPVNRIESEQVESLIPDTEEKDVNTFEPIAIIGMSGMMPQSDNLDEFWEHLRDGHDLITEIPPDRWDWHEYYGDPKEEGNQTYAKHGGFMREVDKFDPLFFGISPKEAELMDPQQRLFMNAVWHAIEDAGYRASELAGSRTSLFVGAATQDYNEILKMSVPNLEPQSLTGMTHSVLANRISYLLNLRGPSQPVDTACSSSLIAIHQAVESIQHGGCVMAIAGGVNVMLTPTLHISESKAGMLSPDGRCKTFDERADGYVRGEGVAVVLLKPLRNAVSDGDHIYAVIRGSAVNHGGRGNSLTAPNPNAQAELLVEAYEKAGFAPNTVSYIEAHGTGTSLGDPVEINGLKKAFAILQKKHGQMSVTKQHCWIGSVKTNIGHLETAAGIAGVVKVLLAMKHATIPASLHMNKLNPYIRLDDGPLKIATQTIPWDPIKDDRERAIPRRAGVSSFGFGGANAHIVLEEYVSAKKRVHDNIDGHAQIILLSAKNANRLRAYAHSLRVYVDRLLEARAAACSDFTEPLLAYMAEATAQILGIRQQDISSNEQFTDLGLDPVHISRLADMISERFELEMHASILANCATLHESAVYLQHQYGRSLQKHFTGAGRPIRFDEPSIRDIAYTLQVGREAMEERLAFVASDLSQLREALFAYASAEACHDTVYVGNSKKGNLLCDLLLEGIEGEQYLHRLIKDKKYAKLAQLWVAGVSIDWKMIHMGRESRRVSLPVYPFAAERYWIPQVKHKEKPTVVTKLHPMVGENISTLDEFKFSTKFSSSDFFIRDHIVNGVPMFPGVAYLELARAAGDLASGRTVYGLRNVVWAKPIIMEGRDCPVHIRLSIKLPQSGSVEFAISTENEIHAQGKLVFEPVAQSDEIIDIESINRRCTASITGRECYEAFSLIGFRYGNAMRSIQRISGNETEAFAVLSLPKELRGSFRDYVLHPALMDGALQTVEGLMNEGSESNVSTYLPFSVGAVDILNSLTETCYVHVRMKQASSASGTKKFTIIIANESGHVAVKIDDFAVRAVRDDVRSPSVVYFKRQWEKSDRCDSETAMNRLNEDVLVLAPNREFIEASKWTNYAKRVVYLLPGQSFRHIGKSIYEVNPGSEADYEQLFQVLRDEGITPRKIIHLWMLNRDGDERADLLMELKKSFYSVLYVYRCLFRKRQPISSEMIYVTGNDHAPGTTFPVGAATYGLLKTLSIESSKLSFKSIEIGASELQGDVLSIAMRELLYSEDAGMAIRYTDSGRYVQKLQPEKEQSLVPRNVVIKHHGVYVITGGAGGIGQHISEYLAEQYQAKLVLVGRSDLSADQRRKIDRIARQYGTIVEYRKADLAQSAEVRKLIHEIKSGFGQINGVIHGAGVIQDSLALMKSPEQIDSVLAPKVYGTMNLDKSLADEPLDFFALFSSVSAVTGNRGQCDYAFGNAFMDHFMLRREQLRQLGQRQGRTVTINWPLWESGGMRVEEHLLRIMEEEAGLVPLPTKEGIAVLEEALASDRTQTIALFGHRRKIVAALSRSVSPRSNESENFVASPVHSEKDFERDITQICAEALKLNIADFQPEDDLSEYGVDSVTMMALLNRLEQHYGETIDPSVIAEHRSIRGIARYLTEESKNWNVMRNHETVSNVVMPESVLGVWESAVTVPRGNEGEERRKAHQEDGRKHGSSGVQDRRIAVIGMACRFPGSDNPEQYWDNLRQGKDLVTEVPGERWDAELYYDKNKAEPGKSYSKWGGFIRHVFDFDAEHFGIESNDALIMDPQHRIILELAEELWARAGYQRDEAANTSTGVFLGGGASSYVKISDSGLADEYYKRLVVNSIPNMMAARISDYFNLKGISQVIDTACSSSLVAIHQACQSIANGEIDMAIAGGIELLLDPSVFIAYSKAGVLSDDGKCYVFDEQAKGFVLGEGAGLILLKHYEKALEDGDPIIGVIAGSAVNNDGKTMGLTVPNMEGQKQVIQMALDNSGVRPNEIGYLEAHGTGTLLGDPIEIRAATQVFRSYTNETQFCAVGSVKSNIGHLARAAGAASIIKVLLALQHKELPPTIHCHSPHPRFKFEESPFYPNRSLQKWGENSCTRTAAISSFGFGGTNCHIIVQEAPDRERQAERSPLAVHSFNRKTYRLKTSPSRNYLMDEVPINQSIEPNTDLNAIAIVLDELEKGKLDIERATQIIESRQMNRG
ncbi:SDR family NAD(P)-dependent oxidoreductase [Paenibacillaceae sp. P-4]|uniref:SDR family NAD(P)-dependent oxidoreductase n=1 Tax=Paenibacillaceae bacterium P-4 TaxID=3160969 RepID=UPI0032E845BD